MTEEQIGKLMEQVQAMATSLQDVKQQIQQAAQDSSQAIQTAKQTAQAIGELQSDLTSRMVIKDDVDIKADERIRATAARGDAYVEYKTNTGDFHKASHLNELDKQGKEHDGELKQATVRLVNSSVDHYISVLSNERVAIENIRAQQYRHSDIAIENQWPDGGSKNTTNVPITPKADQQA